MKRPSVGHVGAIPFSQGGDRKRWIDAERPGNDRAITYVKGFVDSSAIGPCKNLAFVVDNAATGVISHYATTQRMDSDQFLMEELGPDGASGIHAIQLLGELQQFLAHPFKDGLLARVWPFDTELVLFEYHSPLIVVMGEHQVCEGVVGGAVIRTPEPTGQGAPFLF